MPEQNQPGGLLTIEEASGRLGVPVSTLRYWKAGHYGPKWGKIGRRVMYRVADLDAWVAAQFASESP